MSAAAKFPCAVVDDLRAYAAALGLPSGWAALIESQRVTNPDHTVLVFSYEGQPLASYRLDLGEEIESKTHYRPFPPAVDPLVVATELALRQPANSDWRRFNDTVFRISEVAAITGNKIAGGKKRMQIVLRSGKEYECENEENYANSGMSTFEFFLEHVMKLPSANANRSSDESR